MSLHARGQGRCVYLASPVLAVQQEFQQAFAAGLLREYCSAGWVAETNAPAAVELTQLVSPHSGSRFLGLVNFQKEMPNVAALDVRVVLRMENEPRAVRAVSGEPLGWRYQAGQLELRIPRLETVEMVEIT
jgi:hypothetical protein